MVHCHQLFGHIRDPANAIREMLRVTKPGGVMAAREGDKETEIVWPPLPGMLKWLKYVLIINPNNVSEHVANTRLSYP